ncbi:ejaculatory bulb-specific protein 3-like [Epargyreus clarus]|uniref:ejaculatory bulb-specific protein 3-like n=1 Tax=Epargyreus clarus TaxID=520877 RepID=UPI003C30AFBD
MKFLLFAVMLSVFWISVQTESYTSKYDKLDIDEVLANKRLLTAYVKCMTDAGRCTPEGKELKSHITDALKTGCEKCTEKQRKNIRKVIKHLAKYEKEAWKQLVETYDPKRIYSEKYEKEFEDIQASQ